MSDAVVEHSRESINKGSTSFQAASRLFEPRLREDVWRLYAWCRHCDDEIDGQDHGHGMVELSHEERRARLDRLRRLTVAALAGEPMAEPAFQAFQGAALRHGIDSRWPLELLDGFQMDVDERRYDTPDDLYLYCWGVAGVVGVMMAQIMGASDTPVLRRAQDLGLAFQITNICRDIVEDAKGGRVYLPADLLRTAGVEPTPEAVADPANAQALFGVARDLLARAETYYDSARIGLRALPFRSALAIAAARGIYREIGRRILRRGPGALAARMSVPKPLMVWFLLRGAALALLSRLERLTPTPARPPMWSRI